MTCRSEGHPFGHVGVKHSGKREESGPKGHAGCDVSMRRTAGSHGEVCKVEKWGKGRCAGVQGGGLCLHSEGEGRSCLLPLLPCAVHLFLSCPFQSQLTGAQCELFCRQLAQTHAKASATGIRVRGPL